jgi:hypothetical protein
VQGEVKATQKREATQKRGVRGRLRPSRQRQPQRRPRAARNAATRS